MDDLSNIPKNHELLCLSSNSGGACVPQQCSAAMSAQPNVNLLPMSQLTVNQQQLDSVQAVVVSKKLHPGECQPHVWKAMPGFVLDRAKKLTLKMALSGTDQTYLSCSHICH